MSHDPIDFLREDIREIKADLKKVDEKLERVLEWKSKLAGSILVVNGILVVIFEITFAYIKSKLN